MNIKANPILKRTNMFNDKLYSSLTEPVSYTHLDVYKRQGTARSTVESHKDEVRA